MTTMMPSLDMTGRSAALEFRPGMDGTFRITLTDPDGMPIDATPMTWVGTITAEADPSSAILDVIDVTPAVGEIVCFVDKTITVVLPERCYWQLVETSVGDRPILAGPITVDPESTGATGAAGDTIPLTIGDYSIDVGGVVLSGAGAEGPEGPQGPQGIQGIQGIQGVTGNDGNDGATTLSAMDASSGTLADLNAAISDANVPATTDLATELVDLSDVNSSTDTNGFVLVGDGSGFDSRALVKGDVGLANVDDTADADKPVSTDQQTEIDTKAESSHGHSKGEVGLGNVDNTSDAGKPVSSAQQTEIDTKQDQTGALDDLADPSAQTIGHVAVVNGAQDGYTFEAPGSGGASELSDLTDVNSSTDTNGFVLVADGSGFDARALAKADVGLGNVDNTADADKPVSTDQQTEIDTKIDSSSELVDLTDVSGETIGHIAVVNATQDGFDYQPNSAGASQLDELGDVNTAVDTNGFVLVADGSGFDARALVKGDVGLANVDNTADSAKPVSSAQQIEIDTKAEVLADLTDVGSTTPTDGRVLRADGDSWESAALAKADVGLGNVDNTADADKPVSTDQQTEIDTKQDTSEKAQASGYASLDGSALVPDAQIPPGVTRDSEMSAAITVAIDALLDGAPAALDTLNELAAALDDDDDFHTSVTNALAGKQPLDSDLTAIAALTTLAFGRGLLTETSSTTARGTLGLGNVDNTSDAGKPVSTAQQIEIDTKAEVLADLTDVGVTTPTNGNALMGDGDSWESRALAKADVGLANVDNTADSAKPVSTDQQTEIDTKQDAATELDDLGDVSAVTVGHIPVVNAGQDGYDFQVNASGASQLSELSDVNSSTDTNGFVLVADGSGFDARALAKADVGLANVDNTADSAKPVSTDQQTEIDTKIDSSTELLDLTDVSAITIGHIPVVNAGQDGFDFQANAAGASQLDELSDIDDATATDGFVLRGDGNSFEAGQLGLGDLTGTGDLAPLDTVDTAEIDDGAITLAKHANVSSDTFLGRDAIGSGPVESLSKAAVIAILNLGIDDLTDGGALGKLDQVDSAQIVTGSVDIGHLQNITSDSFLARDATGLGPVENLSAATVKTMLALDLGDISDSGALAALDTAGTAEIEDEAVTLAKMAHVVTNRILGREITGTGDVQALTPIQALEVIGIDPTGETIGDVLKVNATQNGFDFAAESGGGASELSDLTDVNTSTDTNGFVLVADGSGFDARALVKGDVGLGSVDNTADADKPVSTATQTEIDTKAEQLTDLSDVGTATDTLGFVLVGDGSGFDARALVKGDVGLGNVDNTTDLGKPISTATQTEIDTKAEVLSDLTDVGSTTATDGNVLRADGDSWESAVLALGDLSGVGALASLATVDTAQITDEAVTLAKQADLAQATIIGRQVAAGTGAPVALTPTEIRAIANVDDGANNTPSASTSVEGSVELADTTETDTGTSVILAVTPDALAGSIYGTKDISFAVVASDAATSIGNGTTPIVISNTLDGMEIIDIVASVHTAGTTNTLDIQLRKRRGSTDADVLTTKCTIDTTEHSSVTGTAHVIASDGKEDLEAGDLLFIDVDAVHSTAALGLSVCVTARLP